MKTGSINTGQSRVMRRLILITLLISGLLAVLVLSSAGLAGDNAANVTRSLPSTVSPGQIFEVTVDFIAPDDGFNGIGLSDFVPTGWLINADDSWNTPNSAFHNITGNEIDYIWFGTYPQNSAFRAIYQLKVPLDATEGTYYFTNAAVPPRLEYYLAGDGPFLNNIAGPDSVTVEVVQPVPEMSGALLLTIGLACLGAFVIFRHRRRTSSV